MNTLWLAWKIIFYKNNPTLQKFSIAASIASIAVGVAGLLVTLGVVNGFHSEIKSRILGLSPHVFVRLSLHKHENLAPAADSVTRTLAAADPQVKTAAFAVGSVMLRSSYASSGLMLKAVDAQAETGVTGIKGLIIKGEWLTPTQPHKADTAIDIVLGKEAARATGVSIGDKVAIIASANDSIAMAMPKIETGLVRVIFESG